MFLIFQKNNNRPKEMAQKEADKLISNIVGYSQQHSDLLKKYNLSYYLNYFDRNKIVAMGDHLHPHEELTQEQFIRIFLLKIQHTEDETLYLALSLKKLFQAIIERTSSTTTIQFSDFTNYLCEKISKQDLDLVIPSKRIAKQRLSPDNHRIREIDLDPPLILNKIAKEIPKISKDLPKKNKKLDEKKGVSKFYYSASEKNIIAIGTLTSSIKIYDQNLKAKNQITPKECKQMQKDIGILSMAFSPKSSRIGALLTNSTMIFWEGGDNYSTQKVIPNKNYGDKIYYFELCNQWVTVDKSSIHFWDIKQQLITETIKCKDSTLITDICEISHLRGLCVSMVTNKQQKILAFYHERKVMAKINLGNAGCHTLHYNKLTQSLVPLGYHNTISIYTVERTLFDVELKYILRGHRSIITCIDSLQQNSLMVTGDDIGEIRIWEVTYMRCVQSVKITKWLCGIKLVGNKLFYSDSRINVMQLDHFQVARNEKIVALYQFYDEKEEAIWILTRKDARKIDFKEGKINRIFVLCGDEQEITSAVQVGDGFVIGNSRGEMFHYDSDCNIRWQKNAHQNQIRQLEYDSKNRLLFTLGSEGKIIAWPERTIETQEQRKLIIFKSKEVNILSISSKNNILIIGNTAQSILTIWDYQILKLYEVLDMQCEVSSIFISETVDLMIIATQNLEVHFIKFAKNEPNLDLKVIQLIDLLSLSAGQSEDIKQLFVVGIKMIRNQDLNQNIVTLATNKGVVFNLDVTKIIAKHFTPSPISTHLESVNILRNQRQDYQNCLNQHGRKITISQLKIAESRCKTVSSRNFWIKKVFKDCINCIQGIEMKKTLLGVVGDEYIKILNIQNGQIEASLNINHPLPIKWNLTIDHHNHLKKDVCEVLKIIDNILKNYGYQMLAKQYKLINLTNFMEKIKNKEFTILQKAQNVQLLSSEYNPQDINGQKLSQPSLKSLEAYKRVKMIKRISQQLMHVPRVVAQSNKEAQLEKEQLIELLSPPQETKLPASQKDKYIIDFTIRLMNSLPLIDPKKKHLRSQQNQNSRSQFKNATNRQNHLFRDTNITRSVIYEKDKTTQWKDQLEQKGMKQILHNLNAKLKMYRLQSIKQNAL